MNALKRIYIADDESTIRIAIKAFLENAGFVVEDFENGDLLLEAFADKPADLVVLDVMMPGSNGFVVCKKLREKSSVPIIMLTARDSDLDYATALDLGSDDYLIKPFSPMALVMRINAIFRRMEFNRKVYSEQDLLTGLFDKVSAMGRIENKLTAGAGALFIIDVDGMKNINDSLGRDAGDKTLIEISKILRELFQENAILCRFGGDEFLVFDEFLNDIGEAAKKAEELKTADKNTPISIGIACCPANGLTYKELLDAAMNALEKAKEKGGNGFITA